MRGIKNGANVIFRRIRGRIVPIYQKHETAANIAAAAGTFIGASVVAEKSRNKLASKIYYKGRKGFNNDVANFTWDAGVTGGLTYVAARKFRPVAKGFYAISQYMRNRSR